MQSAHEPEGTQVDDGDGVALAVGDVSVFVIRGIEVGNVSLVEIPPTESAQDRHKYHDQE